MPGRPLEPDALEIKRHRHEADGDTAVPPRRRHSRCLQSHCPDALSCLLTLLALVAWQALSATVAQAATAPAVTSVSPAEGSVLGGETVTIDGSGFVGAGDACAGSYEVWFGDDLQHGYVITASSFEVLSDSQIRAVVPANFGGIVDVQVHDACGTSPLSVGGEFTYDYPSNQCLTGTCTLHIGATPSGELTHAALGFLDGFNTDAGVTITPHDEQLVDALHPRQWRLGQVGLNEPSGGVFGLARSAGAKVSLDLTSDWEDWAWNADHAYYDAPYGDLSTYYSFIYNDVRQRAQAGELPDYFDVWNEPASTGSVDQWLSVYGTAYEAIKAADPGAQVVGPSISAFLLSSAGDLSQPGYDLSLTDFLNWEMATGYRFAAISWHEDGTTVGTSPTLVAGSVPVALPGGYRDYWSPDAIADHVLAARALLAQYPALSGTQIFVNEYGPTYAVNIPGWMVGDFSALEGAGANEAMITCAAAAACSSELDGLLGADGEPQMPYWVMLDYSQMSGQRLPAVASGANIYALATRSDATKTLEVLVGRADDCWGGQQCPQFHAAAAGPVKLSLSFAVPWSLGAVDVTVQRLPNDAVDQLGDNDVPDAPPTTHIADVPVKDGTAQVTIPAVGDGDAAYVTLSPAAGAHTSSTTHKRHKRHKRHHHEARRHRRGKARRRERRRHRRSRK